MTDWEGFRARLDELGMQAINELVAKGVPREVAGPRIAHFNDMVIEELQKRAVTGQ